LTSKEFRDRLTRRARRFEIRLSPSKIAALETYVRLLVLWNARINLTALRLDPIDEPSLDRLLIEPLVASRFLPPGPVRLLDVGSGSGSPAIPLAVAADVASLTMVEAKTRKAVFLMEAVRQLELDAVVETARFEQLLSRPDMHEAADVLTIRAVRIEPRSLLSLQAFIRPAGQLFWFQGQSARRSPSNIPPPLTWTATHSLVEASGSRLVVLSKNPIGRPGAFHVEP
jgi:16S rRNA (guanine527-N7)-methyltransferase